MKLRINEKEMPYVLWVLDGDDRTWKMYKGINDAKSFIANNDYDEFLDALNTQVYPNETYYNNYIDWIVIPAGKEPKTFDTHKFYNSINLGEAKETPNIEVKHEGILEVPEGKNVDDLPLSHFEKLAKKKGLSKITKALNNLQVWNKNDDPKLSKWAGDMIDKLNKKLKKDESVSVKDIRAITNSERAMDYLTKIQSNERNLSNFTPYERKTALRNTRKYVKYINDEIKNTLSIMQQEEDEYNNYFLQNDLDESLNGKDKRKSFWKYYMDDPAIEAIEDDTYYDNYFDEKNIRKVKLYPCENEEDCYDEDYAWAVRSYEYPHKAIYGTKDEAYEALMYYLNNSMYEKRHDL